MASVIELKDDRLVNPLSTLICWGKHVVSAHIQVHHWCGLSIMRVSFWKTTPFNCRGKQAELSIVLFVIDGYRFNRRLHFKLYRSEWLFGSSSSLLNGCVIVHDAQLLILPCEKMHNCNDHAEGENRNHVITFPTVRLIEFKVPLGLWFLTAGR